MSTNQVWKPEKRYPPLPDDHPFANVVLGLPAERTTAGPPAQDALQSNNSRGATSLEGVIMTDDGPVNMGEDD